MQTTEAPVHVHTTRPEVERARRKLEDALEERDAARVRYEAAIGTSVELGAYVRLRAASQNVSACDKWLRWAQGDVIFPPPADDVVMEGLLPASE